jgi:hypothetical protein
MLCDDLRPVGVTAGEMEDASDGVVYVVRRWGWGEQRRSAAYSVVSLAGREGLGLANVDRRHPGPNHSARSSEKDVPDPRRWKGDLQRADSLLMVPRT